MTMLDRIAPRRPLAFALLAALAATSAGCSNSEKTPDAEVDVPEVPATVSADQFCELYDAIACAGALGCCDAEPPFADEAECLSASHCQDDVDAMLASPLFVAGSITYDARAAAEHLRTKATFASTCAAAPESSPSFDFFAGSLDEGADCSAASGDPLHVYVCKPGLVCRTREDPMTGKNIESCAPVIGRDGGYGDACADAEDCHAGECTAGQCAAPTDLLCEAPAATEPPANWSELSTASAPLALRVTANSDSGSGTSDDITLAYRNNTATYSCTITATIASGGSQECVPKQSSTETSYAGTDTFYVKYTSTSAAACDDGLRITSLSVKHADNTWYENGNFTPKTSGPDCSGCGWSLDWPLYSYRCNNCWIDGDGHGNIKELKVEMNYDSLMDVP